MQPRSASRSRSMSISTSASTSTFVGQGFNSGSEGKLRVRTTANRQLVADGAIQRRCGDLLPHSGRSWRSNVADFTRRSARQPRPRRTLALRKNLAVEAGVEVTGTVQVPLVRLTSEPSVADNEKLARLVLGHGLDSTSGAESVALQAALAALAGSGSEQIGQRVAHGFGVDDIQLSKCVHRTPRNDCGPSRCGQANA